MNIYRASERLKVPIRRIADFSVPVNPLGTSKKVKAELRKYLKDLKRYPDDDCQRMKKHLSKFHGVKPEHIITGSDTAGMINLALFALKPKKLLLDPGCSAYEETFKSYRQSGPDISVEYVTPDENNDFKPDPYEYSKKLKNCDLAILCNPGYPFGYVLQKDEVMEIAKEAERNECLLIVDESYMDYVPDETVIGPSLSECAMIVLRSITGFHALAGLMMAYGITNEHIAGKLAAVSPRCPVNSLAQRAAVIALKDKAYRKESDIVIKEEKAYLEKELSKIGISYYPSSVNYYLLKIPSSGDLYEYLLQRYILVRKCDDIRGVDRDHICVSVNDHRKNTILIKVLREYYTKRD